MSVYVLDREGKPVMPCTEKRARLLLERGRARVHRLQPFVIRLTDRFHETCALQPLRLKLDPGSKITGLALVRDGESVDEVTGESRRGAVVVNLMEIVHRGRRISEALTARRQMRRRRRSHLRYRAPRFLNRGGDKTGWLAPSLRHRIDTTMAWVKRLQGWAPVKALSSELVRFDMQAMQSAEANSHGQSTIEGVEYQRGTLAGYELGEYLLAKWGRACAYCDAQGTPLEKEHIVPVSQGGSNRVSNLTLACRPCNQRKAARSLDDFLAKDANRLARIKAQARRPLKDAAAVNATRWALANELQATGLPVELASGGRTKFNRSQFNVPKAHALDAACVGHVNSLQQWRRPTLTVKCSGRGSYQRTRLDRYGFPRGYLMRSKRVKGFGTGDLVRADVPGGTKKGVHVGRVAIRATGSFNIQTTAGVVQGISHKACQLIQRADGYGYFFNLASTQVASRVTNSTRSLEPGAFPPGLPVPDHARETL